MGLLTYGSVPETMSARWRVSVLDSAWLSAARLCVCEPTGECVGTRGCACMHTHLCVPLVGDRVCKVCFSFYTSTCACIGVLEGAYPCACPRLCQCVFCLCVFLHAWIHVCVCVCLCVSVSLMVQG